MNCFWTEKPLYKSAKELEEQAQQCQKELSALRREATDPAALTELEQWVTLNFAVDGEPFPVHIPVPQTMTIPIPDSYGSWQYDASDPQIQAELLQYLKANGEQS